MAQSLDEKSTFKETFMSDRKRGESKEIRKDQMVRREVLDEIAKETTQEHQEALYRNPNRDQARGDWDRTGRHTDEGLSREKD